MFDKQMLYDRRMTVRMDRGMTDKTELRLPEGLKSIGLGLGANGEPLRDVARNLPQPPSTTNLNLANAGSTIGAGVLGAVPGASVALNGLGTGLSANTLGSNNTLGSSLGLQVTNWYIHAFFLQLIKFQNSGPSSERDEGDIFYVNLSDNRIRILFWVFMYSTWCVNNNSTHQNPNAKSVIVVNPLLSHSCVFRVRVALRIHCTRLSLLFGYKCGKCHYNSIFLSGSRTIRFRRLAESTSSTRPHSK